MSKHGGVVAWEIAQAFSEARRPGEKPVNVAMAYAMGSLLDKTERQALGVRWTRSRFESDGAAKPNPHGPGTVFDFDGPTIDEAEALALPREARARFERFRAKEQTRWHNALWAKAYAKLDAREAIEKR